MRTPTVETVAMILAILLLGGLLFVFYHTSPNPTFAFGLGLIAALATGILVPLVVFWIQTPSFIVWPSGDQWDGVSIWKFIHVVVRNKSSGFMGGGVAGGLRGEIRVDGQEKVYSPKWVDKSEPIDIQYLPQMVPGQTNPLQFMTITRIDPGLIEEAKAETFGPQEEHVLDIAMKVNDGSDCYIHEPENYSAPAHKRNPFGVGDHRISLTLRWGKQSDGPFEFVLKNGPGNSPDSLTLVAADPTNPRTQRPASKKRK